MKTQIQISEAVGKTIQSIHYGCGGATMAIVFADDTFCVIVPKRDRWAPQDDPMLSDGDVVEAEFQTETLLASGIFTAEEWAELSRKREDDRMAKHEERERCEFERLKQKFGLA